MTLRLCFIVESGTDVRLVEGLAKRFRLSVLARRIPGGREVSQPPRGPFDLALGPAGRGAFCGFVLRRLLGHGARWDVLLAQGYGAAGLASSVAGALTRTPVVHLVCSPSEEYYDCRRRTTGGPGPAFYRGHAAGIAALARANARLARRYVVLSDHLASVVRGHGARGDVRVIPVYGVDPSCFAPVPETTRSTTREALGLPRRGSLVLFSSRVAPEKDVDCLLAAWELLLESGADVWLVNRSGGHEQLLAMARARGIQHRVLAGEAVHPTRELPRWYQAADVCVQASRAEGLGFSVLEALACETPVVAAAVGGLRETVRDGVTGWTYAPGQATDLAAKLREALGDREEALRRARAGRRMVLERFDQERVFDELAEALTSATRMTGGRP